MSVSASHQYAYSMRIQRRPFNKAFPLVGAVLLGIVQMLTNGAILGLEAGSVAYNTTFDIIYAGFWCSVSFFFTWVSLFCLLCCGRKLGCGIFLLVLNCISIAFAIVLIVFDSLFITSPGQCYLGGLCNIISTNYNGIIDKQPLIKAQLAMAALMLTTNLVYILLFIITIIRSHRSKSRPLSPSYTPPSQRRHPPVYISPSQQRYVADTSPQYPVMPSAYNHHHHHHHHHQHHTHKSNQWEASNPYFDRFERF